MQFVKHFTTQRNMERSAEPITYVGDHQLMPPSATNLLYSEICKELVGDSMLSDGYHLWKQQKGFMNGSALGNVGSTDWSTALSHDRMRWTPHSTPPKKRMRTERSNFTSHLNSQMLAVGTEAPSFVPDVLNDSSNQSWNTMCLTEPRADLDLTSANLSWSSFLQQTLLDELIVSEFSFSPSSPKECVEKADEPLVRVASDIIPQLSPDALSNVPFRDSLEDDLGTTMSANLSWSSFLQQTLLDELIVSEFSFSPSSPKECVEKADEPLVRVASDIIPQLSPDALSNVPFRDSLEDDLGTTMSANLSWSSFLQQTLLDELIVSEFSFSPSSPKECVEKADEPLVRVASDIIPQLSPDALSNVPFRDSLEDDLGTTITPVLDETALPHIFSPNSTLDLNELDKYLHSDSLEHEWADLLL